jgi:hypothetical protein
LVCLHRKYGAVTLRGMFGRKIILFGGRGRFVWFDRWVGVSMVRMKKFTTRL